MTCFFLAVDRHPVKSWEIFWNHAQIKSAIFQKKHCSKTYSRQNPVITQKLYANFLVKEIKFPLLFPLALCTHLHYQNYTPTWQVDQCLQCSGPLLTSIQSLSALVYGLQEMKPALKGTPAAWYFFKKYWWQIAETIKAVFAYTQNSYYCSV